MADKQALEAFAREFCAENGLHLALSWEMPAGYETAYGTYDIVENTLFLNWALLEKLPRGQQLFYLCHELRHGSISSLSNSAHFCGRACPMSCFMTAPASGFRMGCGGRESWRGKRRTLQTPTWGSLMKWMPTNLPTDRFVCAAGLPKH